MQVENRSPAQFIVGLTQPVADALPLLEDAVAAELARRGFPFIDKQTSEPYVKGPDA
jgi:hypothetical protein